MVDPDQVLLAHVRQRLKHWQPRLGLEAWHIDVSIEPDPLNDLSLAGCHVTAPGRAVLTVREDATPADVEWICVHQLVKLMTRPYQEWLAGPTVRLAGWPEGASLPPEADAACARSIGVHLWREHHSQQLTRAFLGPEPPPLVAAWWYDLLYMDESEGEWFKGCQSRGAVPAGLQTTGPAPMALK